MKLSGPNRRTSQLRRPKGLHLLVAVSLVALSAGVGGLAPPPAAAADPSSGTIKVDGTAFDDATTPKDNEPKPACGAFEIEFDGFAAATHTATITFTVQGGGGTNGDPVASAPDHDGVPSSFGFTGSSATSRYTLDQAAFTPGEELHLRVSVVVDEGVKKFKVIKTTGCAVATPQIEVVKTNDANRNGAFGDDEVADHAEADVGFQLTIKNTGTVPAQIKVITDTVGGTVLDVGTLCEEAQDGMSLVGYTLAVRESISCRFELDDYAPATGSKVNTATVRAGAPGAAEAAWVAASDTSVVRGPGSVTTAPDLKLTKSGPATRTTGQTGDYTLLVENVGTAPATGVITVTDTLPGDVAAVATTTGGFSCTVAAGVVTCTTNDDIAVGGSKTITLPVTFNAAGDQRNTSTVSVSGDANDTNDTSAFTTAVTAPPPLPPPPPLPSDLAMKKTGPASVPPGGTATWTLTVTNKGPGAASGVVLTDTLPAGVSLVSLSGSGFTCSSTIVSCTYDGVLPAGASAAVTLVGAVAGDIPGTSVSNVVTATPTDATPADNTDTLVSGIDRPLGPADLVLEKIGPATMVDAGDPVTWTITVTNVGTSPTPGFTVNDVIEEGTTVVSTSGAGFTCGAGPNLTCTYADALAAGQSVVLRVTVAVAEDYAFPVASNTATAVLPNDPTPENNTDTATVAVDFFSGGGGGGGTIPPSAEPTPPVTPPGEPDEPPDALPFTGSPLDLLTGLALSLSVIGLFVALGAPRQPTR